MKAVGKSQIVKILEKYLCGTWSGERCGKEISGTVCPWKCWREFMPGSNQGIQTGFVFWRGSKSGHSMLMGVFWGFFTHFLATTRGNHEGNND